MPFENSAGLGVFNFFGPRKVGEENIGIVKTEGAYNELIIDVDGAFINKVITDGTSKNLAIGKLPAGIKIKEVILEVDTVFVVGGTSPTFLVGTEGSEATNGVSFTEAQAEAVGTVVNTTFAGTWAAKLAAETQVGFALGGTTPTLSGGKARIIIRYIKAN